MRSSKQMDRDQVKRLLQQVKKGDLTVEDAMERLRSLPYEELGFAKIDTHRSLRRGFPEVIFCEGKTNDQIKEIVKKMASTNSVILALRANEDVYLSIKDDLEGVQYHKDARAVVIGKIPKVKTKGTILVVSAGTADIPVAEEAAVTAEVMGNRVERLYDVGIAGIHRLLYNREKLFTATVLIVVAGMEGALPGVVGGMVDKPVIAVPTSIGYGTNFNGLSALLTMLNSCAPGIGVVNIDNGFGAGYLASLINSMCGSKGKRRDS